MAGKNVREPVGKYGRKLDPFFKWKIITISFVNLFLFIFYYLFVNLERGLGVLDEFFWCAVLSLLVGKKYWNVVFFLLWLKYKIVLPFIFFSLSLLILYARLYLIPIYFRIPNSSHTILYSLSNTFFFFFLVLSLTDIDRPVHGTHTEQRKKSKCNSWPAPYHDIRVYKRRIYFCITTNHIFL